MAKVGTLKPRQIFGFSKVEEINSRDPIMETSQKQSV